MIGVDLGTFGAVMKFALDLEVASQGFYEKVHEATSEPVLKSLFEKTLARCSVRISTLERIRRENVTEMILEPIQGLNSDQFSAEMPVPLPSDDKALSLATLHWETTRHHFFETAAQKIDFLMEAADAFERLADENEETIDKIRKSSGHSS